VKDEKLPLGATRETGMASPPIDEVQTNWQRVVRRRSFLKGVGAAGAVALPAVKLFAQQGNGLTKGDAALLRFAAAIEFVEADLWQQYSELGGQVDHNDNPNPGNPAYIAALQNLDGDMPQYISDNSDDEISHREFLNAYLKSKGAQPIDFTRFETLPPTRAAGGHIDHSIPGDLGDVLDGGSRQRNHAEPGSREHEPRLFEVWSNECSEPLHT
jgi:hypothetical protein